MEKFPVNEHQNIPILGYYASSFEDLRASREQVFEDTEKLIASVRRLKALDTVGLASSRAIDALMRKSHVRPFTAAFIYIPKVRHFPDQDESPQGCVDLNDGVNTQQFRLPEPLLERFLRQSGGNINGNIARNTMWASDIVAAALYSNLKGEPDKLILMHLTNENVATRAPEPGFVRYLGLSHSPSPM